MTENEILANINNNIVSENGVPVLMDSMFMDSELDSLGVTMVLLTLSVDYNIPDDITETLDEKELTIKDLVQTCKSSITNT